ncbi:lysophospholipid acyltransferase family protein [Limnospira fusiformis]|uniref:lysophospholipid acyltransferase family protein n=1 Tax=Limnospira fusiformis TaxID=54297 RepID=UPI001448A527|nr:1-acyl-sn-glycerol-3-phosphate acyltransferase [Limnospira fusiformis SAG 85.79]
MVTVQSIKPWSNSSPSSETKSSGVARWLTSIVYPLGRLVVLPFYFKKITVTGRENLPKDGPVILAPTHRARWDAFIVPFATGPYVTGRDSRFMVTADEMQGLQGWFIRQIGGFAVNQKHPAIATLRYGVDLLRQGEMLVIFPEAGIFRDHQIHPLKAGLGRLAIQAESHYPNLGVKIVPISIHYSPNIPHWRSEVNVTIGKPLEVKKYATGPAKKESIRLMSDLNQALIEIDSL